MTIRGRLIMWGVVGLVVAILATDWLLATARLGRVRIDAALDSPRVVADGKSAVTMTVRVTEEGRPRAGTLLQLWISEGGGLLSPTWVYTDQAGTALVTYQPNPASKYDLVTETLIRVADTGVGRLIEVRKEQDVAIPLEAPR